METDGRWTNPGIKFSLTVTNRDEAVTHSCRMDCRYSQGMQLNIITGSTKQMDQLRQICQERLTAIFGEKDHPLVAERLRQELEMIQLSVQADAFEKARKAVQLLREQRVSCRLYGAGCSSLVSYLMDFSQIDPTEYGLPYERFFGANPHRTLQFMFLAQSHINRPEEVFTAILEESSCDLVKFRKESPLSAIPSLLAEEIRRTDSAFDLTSIPINDETTFELLRSGETEGIDGFEEIEIQHALSVLNPRCLTDIAAIRAIQIHEAQEIGILNEYIRRGLAI